MSLVDAFAFPNVSSERIAADLERLVSETGELEQRARLLGYYVSLPDPSHLQVARKLEHLTALVAARPTETFLAMPLRSDEPMHRRVAEVWRNQVRRHRDSSLVLANAALFLAHWNPAEAELLIRQAIELQPRVWQWRHQLGRLLVSAAANELDPASRSRLAHTATKELSAALDLVPESNHAMLYEILCEAALLCGETFHASAFAQMALDASAVEDWSRGNVLHMAHTVLGCLAFDRNDLPEAVRHLGLSLAVPESPQFEVRGPSKHLLERILSGGHRQIVIAYVDDWRRRFTLPEAWNLAGLDGRKHV
jgi:hypothetical protein